jgi:hypothetical protein
LAQKIELTSNNFMLAYDDFPPIYVACISFATLIRLRKCAGFNAWQQARLALPVPAKPAVTSRPFTMFWFIHVVVIVLAWAASALDISHVIVTRFQQAQNGLLALSRSRLELLKTICLPTLVAQEDQNFVWLILTDPGLDESIKQETVELLAPYSNFFLAETPQPGELSAVPPANAVQRWGIGAEHYTEYAVTWFLGWVPVDGAVLGNLTYIVGGAKARDFFGLWGENPDRLLLLTRLDSDDGVSVDFVKQLQADVQISFSEQQELRWKYYCVGEHVEWSPTTKSTGLEHGSTVQVLSKADYCITAGHSIAVQASHATTLKALSGLWTAWPRHFAVRGLVRKDSVHGGCGTLDCEVGVIGPNRPIHQFVAIRARTWTSAGMKRVGLGGGAELIVLLDSLEKDFAINPSLLLQVNTHFRENALGILQDAYDGQCSTGHSCKKEARQKLQKLANTMGYTLVTKLSGFVKEAFSRTGKYNPTELYHHTLKVLPNQAGQHAFPFLVTSSGGSGTHTSSRALHKFGFAVSHERSMPGSHGTVSWYHAANLHRIDWDRAQLHEVHYPQEAPRFTTVLHQVRCPLQAIASSLTRHDHAIDFINLVSDGLAAPVQHPVRNPEWYEGGKPLLISASLPHRLESAARGWVWWNAHIAKFADAQINVEGDPGWILMCQTLKNSTGCKNGNCDGPICPQDEYKTVRAQNKRDHEPVSLANIRNIDERLATLVKETAHRLGYSIADDNATECELNDLSSTDSEADSMIRSGYHFNFEKCLVRMNGNAKKCTPEFIRRTARNQRVAANKKKKRTTGD